MSAIPQTSPSTVWLDEELRKQKAIVAQLRETVERQQVLLADQTQRSLALEDRLVKLQAQLLRIPEVEEALRHTRDELVLMLSDMRQDVRQRQAEAMRSRQQEREGDAQAVQEIQAELQRFDLIDEALSAREEEERRLNECVLRLEQTQVETDQRVSRQEEAARQLVDRIERNALGVRQMEEVLTEAQEERQVAASRILALETALPKLQQRLTELQSMREQLTRQQDELLESQRRAATERSRALTEWQRQMESSAHQMDGWAEQLRYFADQHDKNRAVLREVEDLARQVSQQQDQLRQVQRIAEDRLRHEFREWRSENERRWAQEAESHEKAEEAEAKRHASHQQRLVALEQWRKEDLAHVANVEARLDDLLAQLKAEAAKLKQAQFSALQMQVDAYQAVFAKIQEFLKDEETPG